MQENTQTTLVCKLNSQTRYVRLRAVLFEYNQSLKSIDVLKVIREPSLRKALRTARNRTESYYALQGLIRKMYQAGFKGKSIIDNQISAHAFQLFANCVIAYNTMLLNNIYEHTAQQPTAA